MTESASRAWEGATGITGSRANNENYPPWFAELRLVYLSITGKKQGKDIGLAKTLSEEAEKPQLPDSV